MSKLIKIRNVCITPRFYLKRIDCHFSLTNYQIFAQNNQIGANCIVKSEILHELEESIKELQKMKKRVTEMKDKDFYPNNGWNDWQKERE